MDRAIIFVLFFAVSANAAKSPGPTHSAANYYSGQHDFRQALPLWREVLQKDPENVLAFLRVAELTLWNEGRASLPEMFQKFLESPGRRLRRETRQRIKSRFWDLQTTFLTDQAQDIYFQGKHRMERGDLRGALEAFKQAANLDRGQFLILKEQAAVEKQLESWEAYYHTLKLALRSFPYEAERHPVSIGAPGSLQRPKLSPLKKN